MCTLQTCSNQRYDLGAFKLGVSNTTEAGTETCVVMVCVERERFLKAYGTVFCGYLSAYNLM